MPTISMKYFSDHIVTSVFNNQSELAKLLDSIGKRNIIESDEISPLTVRLFNLNHGLDRVKKCVTGLRLPPFPTIFGDTKLYNGTINKAELYPTTAASGSMEYKHSFVTNRKDWIVDALPLVRTENFDFIAIDNDHVRLINDESKIHTFHLHSGLYDFFTNLDSSLDRLRLELNSIYFDGAKQLDDRKTKGNKYWSNYLDLNNNAIKLMSGRGYTDIVKLLTNSSSNALDARTSKYRNRLIHDGDLEINIDRVTGKVCIPDDPRSAKINFSIELLPFMESVFFDLQKLLEKIYAQIITDISAKKTLPLV